LGHNCENRLTRVERRMNGTTQSSVRFPDDAVGRLFKVTYSGEMGYVQFGYDAAGRRTSLLDTRLPTELGGQTYTWTYDASGRVAWETYPGGGTVS
jgi:YD repeat-containing protein